MPTQANRMRQCRGNESWVATARNRSLYVGVTDSTLTIKG